jgi:hypothetical protein
LTECRQQGFVFVDATICGALATLLICKADCCFRDGVRFGMGRAISIGMNFSRQPKLTIVLRGAGDAPELQVESRMSKLRAAQPGRSQLAVSRRRTFTKLPLKACDATHPVLWECIRL